MLFLFLHAYPNLYNQLQSLTQNMNITLKTPYMNMQNMNIFCNESDLKNYLFKIGIISARHQQNDSNKMQTEQKSIFYIQDVIFIICIMHTLAHTG